MPLESVSTKAGRLDNERQQVATGQKRTWALQRMSEKKKVG